MTHINTMERFDVWYFKARDNNVYLAFWWHGTHKWEIV